MANIFENITREALEAGITPRTTQSTEWFRRKVQQMTRTYNNSQRLKIMEAEQLEKVNTIELGSMVMFNYKADRGSHIFPKRDPKYIHYDRFPLVVIMDVSSKHLTGLNLHYLAPLDRAKILDKLMGSYNENQFDIANVYKSARVGGNRVHPSYKHYLIKNIKSNISLVKQDEWEIATFLPMGDFGKTPKGMIYTSSKKQLK